MMAGLLYRLSGGLRCRVIKRDRPYLERYFLWRVPEWVPGLGGCQGYLHRFLDSDADEGLHDHPWPWAVSLILAGGYVEQRLKGFGWGGLYAPERWRGPGSVGVITGTTFHRVILRSSGHREAWTLFIHGPYRKRWGFLRWSGAVGQPGTGDEEVGLTWRPFAEASGGGKRWWRDAKKGRDCPDREPPR